MIYNIILFIILFIFGIYDVFGSNKKLKRKFLNLTYVIVFIFLCFRGLLGWDWYFYYPSFMKGTYTYEKGYMFFSRLIGGIYKNYSFYQSVMAFIDLSVFYWFFKKYCKYPIITFAIFLSIQGLQMEVELLRNMKSIIFFLISFQFIEKRKIIPYMFLNFVGCTFHTSSLIYLPMYFILNFKYNKKVVIYFFVIGVVYYLSDIKILTYFLKFLKGGLQERIKGYLDYGVSFRGINYFFVERVIIFLLAYFYERKNIIKNSAYVWCFIFLFMPELPVFSMRIGILFIYSSWLILGRCLINEEKKYIFIFIIFILCEYRIYNNLNFKGNIINYNYRPIFMEKLDYSKREKELIKSKKYMKESLGRELLIQY